MTDTPKQKDFMELTHSNEPIEVSRGIFLPRYMCDGMNGQFPRQLMEDALIARMEEGIMKSGRGGRVLMALFSTVGNEYSVSGGERPFNYHKSRLEATYAAWKVIKEQQQ